ncbi:FGGY-family carbohydrate kinase [Thermotoga caldifontis]|uniref:FGGY-family carbohydrate kinase n=1 Tax=Thermotoga caldifontis TaxID=1508419 RepID=UPI0005976177|nr:FGGY-family carbohydrate kinase [Thermotoga caldifontis]
MPCNSYVLGVDIGTFSSKGVLVKLDGTVVASHSVPHDVKIPRLGFAEHDAERDWWGDFVKITRALLEKSQVDPGRILGVATSGIGPCVLPVDKEGHPLRPAILYGIDTRAFAEIEILMKMLGQERLLEGSGRKELTSQAAAPKILWIRRNEPDIFSKTRWFFTCHSYLIFKLTKRAVIDIYSAAGYAPMFNIFKCQWDPEIVQMMASQEVLPDLAWSYEVVGRVTRDASHETGLLEGTPVVAGTTDAAAEALSVGLNAVGDMMLMVGSSVFFILRTPVLMKSERFWVSNFVVPDFYTILGGMSTAGSITTWFRDNFGELELERQKTTGEDAFEQLAKLALKSSVGAKGLTVLPYFSGERTPFFDPTAKGVIFGLTLAHKKGDIYRAILESVAFGIKHNMDELIEEGAVPERIILAGGILKNELWTKIIADVCQREFEVPCQTIGASFGDAFLVALGVGHFKNISDVKEWAKIKGVVKPTTDEREIKIYEIKYQLFRQLYEQTKELMKKVHTLQEMLTISD